MLENNPADHPAAREEIFVPVIVLLEVESFEDDIPMANDSVYGLSVSDSTRALSKAMRAVREL